MTESLLTRLSKYAASERVSPLENFCSELLAWLVNDWADFGGQLAFLYGLAPDGDIRAVRAETQKGLPRGSSGVIDLWLSVERGSGERTDLLLEVKVEADISDQLDRYADYAKRATQEGRATVVGLLSKYPIAAGAAQLSSVWAGAHRWFTVDKMLRGLTSRAGPEQRFLADQVQRFFREHGMALERVGLDLRAGTRERVHLLRVMEEVAEQVARRLKVTPVGGQVADRHGIYVAWKDSRGYVGGLAYSDFYAELAVYVHQDRYELLKGRWTALESDSALSGISGPKRGRYWDLAHILLPPLDKAFFALDADGQISWMVAASAPVIEALVKHAA